MSFVGNDTIVCIGLIAIALAGMFTGTDAVTTTAVGALGGYIGSKVTTGGE